MRSRGRQLFSLRGAFRMRWSHHHHHHRCHHDDNRHNKLLVQVRAQLVQRLGLVQLEKLLRSGEKPFALPNVVR